MPDFRVYGEMPEKMPRRETKSWVYNRCVYIYYVYLYILCILYICNISIMCISVFFLLANIAWIGVCFFSSAQIVFG